MPIDADKLRELMTRTEGDRLDFKETHHAKAADLAKDLMALANMLAAHDEPAYMLIGVAETPTGTGRLSSRATHHLDEADYHSKIESLIHPVPRFSFDVVPIEMPDGGGIFRVGVFEIKPGPRPVFAIDDAQGTAREGNRVRDPRMPFV